jgi:hypothetical protein
MSGIIATITPGYISITAHQGFYPTIKSRWRIAVPVDDSDSHLR